MRYAIKILIDDHKLGQSDLVVGDTLEEVLKEFVVVILKLQSDITRNSDAMDELG